MSRDIQLFDYVKKYSGSVHWNVFCVWNKRLKKGFFDEIQVYKRRFVINNNQLKEMRQTFYASFKF